MVPTTRLRGATAPTNSNDDETSSNEGTSAKTTKSAKSTNNKVYRKAPPKLELQQLQFPAKRKTVRAKKTRHSLPNSTPVAKKGKKTEEAEDEDLKQKTLTQMRWTGLVVPSTFQSDEDMDDIGSEEEGLVADLTAEDPGDGTSDSAQAKASSVRKSTAKKKTKGQAKQPAEPKRTINRGRKRRKTTGELELALELEYGDDEQEEVSSSKYHTQTLTQMPSWKGLAEMAAGGLDEEPGIGFDGGLFGGAQLDDATPPSKKRKISSPIFEHEVTAPQHALPQPPESTAASSVVPETPSRQRVTRTEIPSSQPSPFTPNLDVEARFWSPLGAVGVDRTPLKEISSNVDAPTPTVRKRRRSEIPDSWSTVNGGMPSSGGGRSAKREPLKAIHLADLSVELGEDDREEDVGAAEEQDGEKISQRTADDIIMDSDDEFEGFPDEVEAIAKSLSPSPQQSSEQHRGKQCLREQTNPESTAEEADGSTPLKANETQEESAEAKSADADKTVSTRQFEQIATSRELTSVGSRLITPSQEHQFEIVELEVEEVVKPTPSACISAPHPSPQLAVTHSSSAPERATEENVATPTQTMRNTTTQQPYSHPGSIRSPSPKIAGDEDETEPETPARSRRRPSSSSAIGKETPFSSPQKTSPAMPPISQLGYKSQAFESQRVPFETIQQMAPQTDRSDAIVSANPDEVKHIVDGTYTHIFRDFRIPKHVVRIWIYITAPLCQLKYMAVINDWKMPGDIKPEDQGIGTAEFNASGGTKYANELLQVYQLNNPVSLERMKEDGWVEQAPLATRLIYVPPGPLGALMGNLRCALFEENSGENQSHSPRDFTVSQELHEQLRSDMEHSTQLMRGSFLSSPAKQRRRPRHTNEQHDEEQMNLPSSQDEINDRIKFTPMRTGFSSEKQVVFAKPKAVPSRSQRSMIQIEDSSPITRHSSQQSQRIIKSTVRPSQATTMSVPSQSQPRDQAAEYLTIPDSPSPVQPSAADKSSSLPMVVDDSPIPMRAATSSCGNGGHTQSSLGLGALLGSSQGFGLAGIGGEQDSLMDDSRIRMPPNMKDVVWDSEGE